jgi:biotin transport system substrate-specific component
VSSLDKLLWAVIGLLLTIGGMFISASMVGPIWNPDSATLQLPTNLEQVHIYPLQVTYQVGAVLLIGCMGGKEAAAIAQIAYLVLGLSGFQVFAQGGTFQYLREPTFGYLLGFVPGAWICGYLAFLKPPKLERLALSCLAGLLAIHTVGLLYLAGLSLVKLLSTPWLTSAWQYSVLPLGGQIAIICAVTIIARLLRLALFY